MRIRVFALAGALLLVIVAGQNILFERTNAETTASAKTACAVQGESCSLSSLDSAPASVLSHTVFAHACPDSASDLHVMRYLPTDGGSAGTPVVATWCT